MAAEFYDASEEMISLAKDLIEDHHGHLVEANIKYLFRTGNWEVKKRDTWGQAKKVGKEVNFLTGGIDFLIIIHRDVWEQLTPDDKKALLDHELQHCSAGTDDAGNKIWYIQGHDVEDFHAIIRRHGLWSPALKKIETALEMRNQRELDFGEQEIAEPAEELPAIAGRPKLTLLTSESSNNRLLGASDDNGEDDNEDSDPDYIDVEVIRAENTAGG